MRATGSGHSSERNSSVNIEILVAPRLPNCRESNQTKFILSKNGKVKLFGALRIQRIDLVSLMKRSQTSVHSAALLQ
jgi:hypothetical protein